jgi:hypothetical protein
MGKIILEFDSIEESEEAKTAFQAGDWKQAMWAVDQRLRSIVKYGEYSEEITEFTDKLREEIREMLYSDGLKLD